MRIKLLHNTNKFQGEHEKMIHSCNLNLNFYLIEIQEVFPKIIATLCFVSIVKSKNYFI